MSFKRDESDPGPLGALQKRRVAELLASAIPEDEALLLRNGRFACSVCPHRPVCDTLETLVVHRAGRKHLDSLQRCYGRSRSLQVTPQGPQVTPQGPQESSGVQAPLLAQTRRITQNALLRSAPYSSCCRRERTKGRDSRVGISRMIPNFPQNPGNPEGSNPELLPGHRGGVGKERRKENSRNSQNSQNSRNFRNSQNSQNSQNSRNSEELSEERMKILRHHLQLKSSGWIQDSCGNWVKDENVEFDSDEEEPPPL